MKNLIFDLGGVIIPLDTALVNQTLKRINPEMNTVTLYAPLFLEYELGNISSAEFRQGLREFVNLPALTDEQVDEVWNSLLLPIPIERIHFLQKLSATHKLFLLSNTNEIHLTKVQQILQTCTGIAVLESLFEKNYYSHILNMRKPDKEIYEAVLYDAGISATETCFIDDNKANAEAATSVGIKGVWLNLEQETVLDLVF